MAKGISFYITAWMLLACISCNTNKSSDDTNSTVQTNKEDMLKNSPVLTPEESLKAMTIEDGFEVKLVASEPMITTPVAMSFDDKGRMWVIEMDGYMPDTLGNGEDRPDGKIVILEDKNGDGIADDKKLFMDSLVLPRAMCLIENGMLVAEPPRLWYVEIKNDRPVKKILVDSAYAVGGNVEHQPNGLIRALDNWIYSSDSDKRYRKKGDKWLVEKTHYRGQWGIVQDDYGRMYYNNNSQNLLGDYFMPSLGSANKNQDDVSGFDMKIGDDNRVYPARPTTGVNRGYMPDFLDDSLRLVNFTAACGPVVYRGDLFEKAYYNNAFVAEPSANLVKRNILIEQGYTTTSQQAYKQKEFIASIDERFRPVSLYNAPDGAIYMVDMYRGIIQHKTYLTDYLKSEIKKRALSKPLNCGRIYKIIPVGKKTSITPMPTDTAALVKLFSSGNGWIRDKAQQMLIDGKYVTAQSQLRSNLQSGNPLAIIHSLWTLEGLSLLQLQDVLLLLKHSDWKVRMEALNALSSIASTDTYKQYLPALQQMLNSNDTVSAIYIAMEMPSLVHRFDPSMADKLLLNITQKYPQNIYIADAVINNLENREAAFYKKWQAINPDSTSVVSERFKRVLEHIRKNAMVGNEKLLKAEYPKGVQLFLTVCKTCHGADGNGVKSLAPPLNHSEWVTGDRNKLITIVLNGLTGPVKVNNKVYQAPEISGEMPGMINNTEATDEAIAQVLSYIRKNWGNKSGAVSTDDVTNIRKKLNGRQKPFTVEELEKP
ncbi:MAG: c-type cytochrome [Agriterribacter sp.]